MNSLEKSSVQIVVALLRAYPGKSTAMIVFLLLSGLFEGIGVMAFLPLISLATGEKTIAESTLGRWTEKLFDIFGTSPSVGAILIVIVVGMTLKGICTLFAMKEVGFSVAHVMTDLRLQLIRALLSARWRYFVSQPIGTLTNAISSEVVRAAQVYQSAAQMIALSIQGLVYAALVLIVSWQVALSGAIVGGCIALIFRKLINATRRAGKNQTELLNSLTSRLTDALSGIKPIKAMGYEKDLLPLLETETEGLNSAQQRQIWTMELLRVMQEPLLTVVIAGGLYLALVAGNHTFSELLVTIFLFYRLLNRVHAIQQTYQAVAVGESAYLSVRRSIALAASEQEVDSGTELTANNFNQIHLDHVSFSYEGRDILRDVSLTVSRGEFVVIVGPSGSGKTTLIDLLTRLIEPHSGEIRIDDTPLKELQLSAWRRQIGYVPQEMLLLHDSIFKNVSLGDQQIGKAEVEAALRNSGAWEFVELLPRGMDTVVGERGAKLSGGQRQRISLARALARKPRLLILDEVTASLDPQSEDGICDTLIGLSETVTIIAVSHQPAILRAAKNAYRLADGRLVSEAIPKIIKRDGETYSHV